MRFHIPKPLHGWLEFAGEVGIIVIGVLIALGAQQVVEDWNSKEQSREAQEAIFAELASDAGVLDERTMQGPCLAQNLQQVSTVIGQAYRTGHLGTVQGIMRPAIRGFMTSAWDSAIADGTASRLPKNARDKLAQIYPVLLDYRHQLDEGHALRHRVQLLQGIAGRFPDDMFINEANAVAELKYRERIATIEAEQELANIRTLGIKPSYDLILDRPGTREEIAALHGCDAVRVDGQPVNEDKSGMR